jgi:hypothetical protein
MAVFIEVKLEIGDLAELLINFVAQVIVECDGMV